MTQWKQKHDDKTTDLSGERIQSTTLVYNPKQTIKTAKFNTTLKCNIIEIKGDTTTQSFALPSLLFGMALGSDVVQMWSSFGSVLG